MYEATATAKTRNAIDAAHQARGAILRSFVTGLFRRTHPRRSGAATIAAKAAA